MESKELSAYNQMVLIEDTDESDEEKNDVSKPGGVTAIDKVGLNGCQETLVGDKHIYHRPVKVHRKLKMVIPAPVSQLANPSTSLEHSLHQSYAAISHREGTDTSSVITASGEEHQSRRQLNEQYEEIQSSSGNSNHTHSVNSEYGDDIKIPLIGETKIRFSKRFLICAILGLLTIMMIGMYELIIYFKFDPYTYDDLPMNFTERFVTRGEWFAFPPTTNIEPFTYKPPPFLVVCHTAGKSCSTKQSCRITVRDIQAGQMSINYYDIAYNFLVGGDGYIYEGRGWDESSAGTSAVDCSAISVAFIGNFITDIPFRRQLNAFKLIIDEGTSIGKLPANYKMFLQKQIKTTESPGEALVEILIKWTHWSPFGKEYLLCNSTTLARKN